jgi:hypothetical protein
LSPTTFEVVTFTKPPPLAGVSDFIPMSRFTEPALRFYGFVQARLRPSHTCLLFSEGFLDEAESTLGK